jgi:hypothetical protein
MFKVRPRVERAHCIKSLFHQVQICRGGPTAIEPTLGSSTLVYVGLNLVDEKMSDANRGTDLLRDTYSRRNGLEETTMVSGKSLGRSIKKRVYKMRKARPRVERATSRNHSPTSYRLWVQSHCYRADAGFHPPLCTSA